MSERALLVACDDRLEAKIRENLAAQGSVAMSVMGVHHIGDAVRSFQPTLVIVDDRKIGPHQVIDELTKAGLPDVRVQTLSVSGNEYGAAIGIGIIDMLVDSLGGVFLSCLGCLGLTILGGLAAWIFRWF